MRLLNVEAPELELDEFFGDRIPPYAILSHTWEEDEVLFRDLERREYKRKLGFRKIKLTCDQARTDGLKWCWVDTCCIDKSSSAELSEAINLMFNWYKRAQICYSYLADVDVSEIGHASETTSSGINQAVRNVEVTQVQHAFREHFPSDIELISSICDDSTLNCARLTSSCDAKISAASSQILKAVKESRWFGRGWTLQELIAPRMLRFYDVNWHFLGNRDSRLSGAVYERTGLNFRILGQPQNLRDIPIAQRMSWMADRQTTRKEDEAYCMLGIFGINMPLLYGEEDGAFTRLQEELIKRSRDHSLLMFLDPTLHRSGVRRILAASPRDFRRCREVEASGPIGDLFPSRSYNLTNDGIEISLPLIRGERSRERLDLAVLDYSQNGIPLGLALGRGHPNGELRYVENLRYCSIDNFEPGTPALQWLGTGVVSIPEEIAMTAERQKVLIRADGPLERRRHDLAEYDTWIKYDTWLRYDLALQYELASPDCGLERSFVEQRSIRPPHMIRLRPFRSEIVVLKFSLEDIEPLVIVAAFDFFSRDEVGAALLVIEGHEVTTPEQLSMVGANMCHEIKNKNVGRICIDGGPLASTCLEDIGMLELRHDGVITCSPDGPLGLRRVTLRLKNDTYEFSGKSSLSDGREV